MVPCDMLKHKAMRQIFLSGDIISRSHWRLRYTMIAKQTDVARDVFLVCLPVKCCDMLHHFFCNRRYIIKHLFHEYLCPIAF